MPELSIITVNLNNLAGLQKTIDSVFDQSYQNFEYLIIDGDSIDGSKELIKKNVNKFSYWISERDEGIYNAMNKGIVKAKGEYLLFLNSGDFLIDENSLSHFFINNTREEIICADIRINENGQYWIKQAPDKLSFDYFTQNTLPHQSAVIKKTLFDRAGLYNEKLKFVADWKFYLDVLCKFNATYKHLPVTISEYNFDGITSRSENAKALQKEREDILANEYSIFYEDYKNYHENRALLKNYRNSRAHTIMDKVMQWPIYQFFKRRTWFK